MSRALVIGAGVAGPAVAMFLQRAGWEVGIYESDAEPDPFEGLFLNVATNGLAVLAELGMGDRLLSDGHRAPRMVMRSGTGRELGTVPNGPAREPERGSVIVRRGWLHQVIREAAVAAGVPFTFAARQVSIEETPTGVRATFEDGRVAEGDILIGADGIGSPAMAASRLAAATAEGSVGARLRSRSRPRSPPRERSRSRPPRLLSPSRRTVTALE